MASWLVDVEMRCDTCGKVWNGTNALMVAKRHHNLTGHHVHGNQTIQVEWGDSTQSGPKQKGLKQ